MKVLNKFLMLALIATMFAACKDDEEEQQPQIQDVVGTYTGTISIPNLGTNPNVPIVVTYLAGDTVKLTIAANAIPLVTAAIDCKCGVSIANKVYSLNGTTQVSVTVTVGEEEEEVQIQVPVKIEIKKSESTIANNQATILINVSSASPQIPVPGLPLIVTFTGQK
ncbi:MAG: hypothetical protein LBT50_01655 [Prevotellaceae bacterium]|jgi:hypothetical protein|nr:hypothetical protein [Prevotellaceae bacterium]